MKIPYKVVKISEPGIKGGGKYKYYARLIKRRKFPFRELCEKVAKMSTISEGDLMGAVYSLAGEIPWLLCMGYTVELPDIGIFSMHIGSEGKDAPEKVNTRSINDIRIHFRPSKRMKEMIKEARFVKVK